MVALPRERNLKRQALELLEWAIADMSPPNASLRIKCGFEREGHFIPRTLQPPGPDPISWSDQRSRCMLDAATAMKSFVGADTTDLKTVYYDQAGSFMLEGVTNAVGLVQAADAIDRISKSMLAFGKKEGMSTMGFGPVAIDGLIASLETAGNRTLRFPYPTLALVHYDGEVFGPPGGKTLVGRGQHCNLSVWLGNTNLFVRNRTAAPEELLDHVAVKSLEWLPYLFLPCRKGNYHRIQAGSALSLATFSINGLSSCAGKSNHVMRYTADLRSSIDYDETTMRLEYRQGASEADPYDVAIASAAPLVKACDESLLKDKNGKIQMDASGNPTIIGSHDFPFLAKAPVPKSEDAARVLFNRPDNPYFIYLNALAARKLKRMEEAHEQAPSSVTAQDMRAARQLQNIGTRLYHQYCKEYAMPPNYSFGGSPPKRGLATPGGP